MGNANGYAGLDSAGKVPLAQINEALIGAMNYRGTWNASTNSPAIPAAAAGNKGYYYVVASAGTANVSGITDWQLGDWIVSNGTSWNKIDSSDKVSSVAGLMGVITAVALKTALGLGTAAEQPATAFADAAQGGKADSAMQPGVEDQMISGGARVTVKDLGNLSGATKTPDPGDRPIQKITNNGAGTIAPGSNYGTYLLQVINAGGAGAIATTGWVVKGDSFDTTNGSKFVCSCLVTADMAVMNIIKVA